MNEKKITDILSEELTIDIGKCIEKTAKKYKMDSIEMPDVIESITQSFFALIIEKALPHDDRVKLVTLAVKHIQNMTEILLEGLEERGEEILGNMEKRSKK